MLISPLTLHISYTWSAWVKNNNFTEWSTVWSQTTNVGQLLLFLCAHNKLIRMVVR